MYNNEVNSSTTSINKIQPKVNDTDNRIISNNINTHDSKASNSPSTSPADKSDLSCDNKK